MSSDPVWIVWVIGGGVMAVFLGFALRAGRRLRFLADTPTSKARGVFIGQVEMSGAAMLRPPLVTYLAGKPAVWFRYDVAEEWARWETETSTDSKGKTVTRTVRKTGWNEIASGGHAPPFLVEDDSGAVLVRPDGADIESVQIFEEIATPGSPVYYGKGPREAIADSTHTRRFSEVAIPLGATVFVAGRAREREDVVAPEIAADKQAEMFVISCRPESKLRKRYRVQFWLLGILALLPLPAAYVVTASPAGAAANLGWLVGLAFAVVAVWVAGATWMAFNSLVQLRNRADQAWALVDIQLKRRADLIPRLVSVVTASRDHEQVVQTEVAALRAQAVATPPWEPGSDVASVRSTVVTMIERYPQLKTDDAFLRLQRELSDTETRIALARDYFNEIATFHNTRLEIIPDRWIAGLAGLRHRPLLQAASFERAAVTVSLDRPTSDPARPSSR